MTGLSREFADFWQAADEPGLTFLHARFVTHEYGRHAHPEYAFGVIECGRQTFDTARPQFLDKGDIVAINPEEVHDGRSNHPEGYSYRMFYAAPELVRRYILDDADSDPVFRSASARDPGLAAALLRYHRLMDANRLLPIEAEAGLLDLFEMLFRRHGRSFDPRRERGDARVRLIRELVLDAPEQAFTLRGLAQAAGLSRRHFTRLFRRDVGIAPHQFVIQAKLRAARRLIEAGEPVAEAAAAMGFADQSHFGRHFKRHYGFTPKQLVAH